MYNSLFEEFLGGRWRCVELHSLLSGRFLQNPSGFRPEGLKLLQQEINRDIIHWDAQVLVLSTPMEPSPSLPELISQSEELLPYSNHIFNTMLKQDQRNLEIWELACGNFAFLKAYNLGFRENFEKEIC